MDLSDTMEEWKLNQGSIHREGLQRFHQFVMGNLLYICINIRDEDLTES